MPGFAQSRGRTSTSRLYDGFPGVDRAASSASSRSAEEPEETTVADCGWRRLEGKGGKLHRSRHSLWRHRGALLCRTTTLQAPFPLFFFFAQLVKAYGLSPAMPYIGFSSLRGDNSCRPTHGSARPDASDSGLQSLAIPDTSHPHAAHSTAYHSRAHSIVCYGSLLFDIQAVRWEGKTAGDCGTLRNISLRVSPPF